jgi:hypothetical protein
MASSACNTVRFTAWALPQPDKTTLHLRDCRLGREISQAYFGGIVAMTKVIRRETSETGAFDRSLTPDEIMDRLEQRVGPEGQIVRAVPLEGEAAGAAGN